MSAGAVMQALLRQLYCCDFMGAACLSCLEDTPLSYPAAGILVLCVVTLLLPHLSLGLQPEVTCSRHFGPVTIDSILQRIARKHLRVSLGDASIGGLMLMLAGVSFLG